MNQSDKTVNSNSINFVLGQMKSSRYLKNDNKADEKLGNIFNYLKSNLSNSSDIKMGDIQAVIEYEFDSDKKDDAVEKYIDVISGFDNDKESISLADFGIYQKSYEVLESIYGKDSKKITDDNLKLVANTLASFKTDGDKTLSESIKEALKADKNAKYDDFDTLVSELSKNISNKRYFSNVGSKALKEYEEYQKEIEKEQETKEPATINVESWKTDSSGKVTTKDNETLSRANVDVSQVRLSGMNDNGFGVYYEKNNSVYNGNVLGYYTTDSAGERAFYEFDENSKRRLPEGFSSSKDKIKDSKGNTATETNCADVSDLVNNKGYILEQGHQGANRMFYDSEGNVAGYINYYDDGYASYYIYDKPIALENVPKDVRDTSKIIEQREAEKTDNDSKTNNNDNSKVDNNDDATKTDGKNGDSKTDNDNKTDDNNSSSNADDDRYSQYAQRIFKATAGRMGTDEDAFDEILNDETINAQDWIRIIKKYNELYKAKGKSFIQAIDGDFSGGTKDIIMEKISEKLLEALKNNNDNVDVICEELFNATSGKVGTADEFVKGIILSADDNALKLIVENYSKINENHTLYEDIKKDFSGKPQKELLNKLEPYKNDDAKSKYKDKDNSDSDSDESNSNIPDKFICGANQYYTKKGKYYTRAIGSLFSKEITKEEYEKMYASSGK